MPKEQNSTANCQHSQQNGHFLFLLFTYNIHFWLAKLDMGESGSDGCCCCCRGRRAAGVLAGGRAGVCGVLQHPQQPGALHHRLLPTGHRSVSSKYMYISGAMTRCVGSSPASSVLSQAQFPYVTLPLTSSQEKTVCVSWDAESLRARIEDGQGAGLGCTSPASIPRKLHDFEEILGPRGGSQALWFKDDPWQNQ